MLNRFADMLKKCSFYGHNRPKTALMEQQVYMNETHLLCERRRNTEEDAAEIMQADFQSSGLFCFVTTKRIYLNFWGGFCICELLCVYIKIVFGQD